MRRLLLVLVLLGCSERDDKLEHARQSAAKAKAEQATAEAQAQAAKQEAAFALEDLHDTEKELADVRRQAAELTVLAKKKIAELTVKRDAEPDAAKRDALTKQIEGLERAIAQ